MTILQIVRLYRVLEGQTQTRHAITRPERPKPGKKETNGPFSVMSLFFSYTRVGVARR